MPKIEFKKGDVYNCTMTGNIFYPCKLTVTGWDDEVGRDKTIYFKTDRKIHNKVNHKARVWWFEDYCRLSNQPEIDSLKSENKELKQLIQQISCAISLADVHILITQALKKARS